ncbi:MAG: anhydro-N-acetylmuramic acid kinase [Chromatiales bacterium]|nr:anhydro-N-acetylmuramic acid kinase [Chromatiales bacterium]
MHDESWFIGLISGTSMDGIDAALLRFGERPSIEIAATLTCPYTDALAGRLRRLARGEGGVAEMGAAHVEVAEEFASAAGRLLAASGIPRRSVTAIGSHGQTIWHNPEGPRRFSIQLGDPGTLAARTGIPVVADFRNADLALGGQGAPLVPPLHRFAFNREDRDRAVLNLGGIANLTLLPARGQVTAWDTGPGNTLLDAWCRRQLGQPFDEGGRWAAGASVHPKLLAELRADAYFGRRPPKSTGPEHFSIDWLEKALRRVGEPVDVQRVQATLAELTAVSIAQALRDADAAALEVGVCGGGVWNTDLLERLRRHLPGCRIESTSDWGLPPSHVEAVAFAFLARERLHGRPGNLPTVTGASAAVPLGGLYLPPPDLWQM